MKQDRQHTWNVIVAGSHKDLYYANTTMFSFILLKHACPCQ